MARTRNERTDRLFFLAIRNSVFLVWSDATLVGIRTTDLESGNAMDWEPAEVASLHGIDNEHWELFWFEYLWIRRD
ncbi:hypothetical protein [Haladaptatus halobius]|uniref:hypothetical protein n=1 Tax=Haladaptatus halobius TaxID=2884875 RepID=UPI001D09A269|nr:hypothetical protein [Haladaptatus halobius]